MNDEKNTKGTTNGRLPYNPITRMPFNPTTRMPFNPTARLGGGSGKFFERFATFKNTESNWNTIGFTKNE
ncbi:MAG: hypothetical protein HKN25_06950 [Pyrinomonadaceae bacterium]|nr:hypothetical protein [Pyrinomonadaceae bacterium]